MEHLHILFYSAAYFTAFGSIFPTEDICSLIPVNEADVAILEEPEHLNWFRMPKEGAHVNSKKKVIGGGMSMFSEAGPASFCGRGMGMGMGIGGVGIYEQMKLDSNVIDMDLKCEDEKSERDQEEKKDEHQDGDDDENAGTTATASESDSIGPLVGKEVDGTAQADVELKTGSQDMEVTSKEIAARDDDATMETPTTSTSTTSSDDPQEFELGWAHKFKFVVGVIHTNYAAYMKQYGIGTTLIAAPAINTLSSMVVRAYCHKVVRLSGVIPSYAKWKEVTCNVHGVRGDFLLPPSSLDEAAATEVDIDVDTEADAKETKENDDDNMNDCAPIYFIGKLLWAKGFDRMLKVQEKYRRANPKREYFPIDVYGGGPDETAIVRAFHGRLYDETSQYLPNTGSSSSSDDDDQMLIDNEDESHHVFSKESSLRDQLKELTKDCNDADKMPKAYDDAKNYINLGFELVVPDGISSDSVSRDDVVVMERRKLVKSSPSKPAVTTLAKRATSITNPLSIISDVSEKSVGTGIATTKAVKTLADSALKAGFAMTFTPDDNVDQERGESDEQDIQTQPSFRFDPPKSIYELRRKPIPARFLGVKDHALLRDMPYKIFLNPSITEVLCTTTAEALAMGKFAIIPKHTSNDFFLQFPNCLAYSTMKECVEKIQWALDNDPAPLTPEQAHIFTWHAATDRLIESSRITRKEARDRSKRGCDKADSRMAWLHSEGAKKGKYIKNFFDSPKPDNDINSIAESSNDDDNVTPNSIAVATNASP